jgi:hypothetical protein
MKRNFVKCEDCPYTEYVHSAKDCRDFCDESDLNTFNAYTPSSTYGDYSPSNPWNAPGMSVKDFI